MKKPLYLILILCLLPLSHSMAWEPYDRVVAVVNNRPIVESEVNMKFAQRARMKAVPPSKVGKEKSLIIDRLIEANLVSETAEEQSIIVTDLRLIDSCATLMREYFGSRTKDPKELEALVQNTSERLKIWLSRERSDYQAQELDREKDRHLIEFMAYVEKKQFTDFDLFLEDLRSALLREQVMSIAIGISPPAEKEARAWYRTNRAKLGFEVHVKHILVIPRSGSLADERAANAKISAILARAKKGESFEKLAVEFSQDPGSAAEGGDLGWMMIGSLDPYFAGYVARMKTPGQLSQVFKSSYGYHVVKFLGKRDVTYESAREIIMRILYNERLMDQFNKWAAKRRQQAEIRIFMENYVKAD